MIKFDHVLFLFSQKSKARRRIFLKNSLEFEIFKTRSKILAFSHTKRLESSQRKLKDVACNILILCMRTIFMPKIISLQTVKISDQKTSYIHNYAKDYFRFRYITTVMPSFPSTTCTNKDITEFSLLLINSLQKNLFQFRCMASFILIQLIHSIIFSSRYVCYGCYY